MGLFGPPDVTKMKAKRDVKGLIEALRYEKDWMIRATAVEALGELGDPNAFFPVLAMLKDKNAFPRSCAVKALNDLGAVGIVAYASAPPGTCPVLYGADGIPLNTSAADPTVRLSALATFVVSLLVAALHDADSSVRGEAVTALGRLVELLGPQFKLDDVRVVEPLIEMLKDGRVRARAAGALVRFGEVAVMPLVAALKGADKREGVLGYRDEREAAFDVLGRIGAPAILPVCAALADSDWEVRTFAARMLGRAGDRRAVPALVTALEDRWDVGCAAAEALGKLGWQPPMDERGARYWALRGEIGKCAEIGAPALGVLIAAAVKGGSEQICQEAAQVLVKNGAQSVEPLLAALGSADPFVRRVAAEVLGKIGDARAVEPLIHRLQAKDVSDAAATALGALRDRRAVEPLIASLEDSHDATRAAAAEALAQIGDSSAVEPLIHRLQDKGDSVRLAATEALALIGDSSAIEPLIHRLQDKGDSIRVAAAKGLVSLYRSGNLDMQMRQRILSQRDSITERHIDRATDCGAHVDSGIGVDFPL